MTLTAETRTGIERWLQRDPDRAMRDEVQALLDASDHDELERRFNSRLAFGTAGLRGLVGAGPGRMNRLVVRETSAGLGAYIDNNVDAARQRGIVVTYDARPDSKVFAEDASCVLLGLGFKVYLTDREQPTPVGAYAITRLGAAAGIVITASHNPPAYNGYKVYWENGAQIIPPHDAGIAAEIDRFAQLDLPFGSLAQGEDEGRLVHLGCEFEREYRDAVVRTCLGTDASVSDGFAVAYTALHGVGGRLALDLGARVADSFFVVEEQQQPDGSFPTVDFPNPEERGAMDAVIALAAEHGALLACANDPDADRFAVAVRDATGDYRNLSGDQIGVLLGHYLLQEQHDFQPIVCASLVSSRMLGKIATELGAYYIETLTGFKWLANSAKAAESNDRKFLFAYEEALGYAMGQLVCDKDGLSAMLLFLKLAAELRAEQQTVFDRLESLYRQFGVFVTSQFSIDTSAVDAPVTTLLRENPPASIAGATIRSKKDLLTGSGWSADQGDYQLDGYPADVLVYYLDDDSRIIVRPSGTEPKVKCYYEVCYQPAPGLSVDDALSAAQRRLHTLADQHQAEINLLLDRH